MAVHSNNQVLNASSVKPASTMVHACIITPALHSQICDEGVKRRIPVVPIKCQHTLLEYKFGKYLSSEVFPDFPHAPHAPHAPTGLVLRIIRLFNGFVLLNDFKAARRMSEGRYVLLVNFFCQLRNWSAIKFGPGNCIESPVQAVASWQKYK